MSRAARRLRRHIETDPACRWYSAPLTPLGRFWHRLRRGRWCVRCLIDGRVASYAEGAGL